MALSNGGRSLDDEPDFLCCAVASARFHSLIWHLASRNDCADCGDIFTAAIPRRRRKRGRSARSSRTTNYGRPIDACRFTPAAIPLEDEPPLLVAADRMKAFKIAAQLFEVVAGILIMLASLIGRWGSSAFRLSTTTASMSLTGSRFFSNRPLGVKHFRTYPPHQR